jgi:RNA polymerase sigma-70 factor (ECF subfamily)
MTKMAAYYARRCGEDPDDLLQEAWHGLFEALPDLDTRIGCPEQHLVLRARWKMLDAIKRARIRRCAPLDEDLQLPPAPCASEEAVTTASMHGFVRELTAAQQQVVDCLLEGLTMREAGERLGCTSANIAYHARQIRRRFEVHFESSS